MPWTRTSARPGARSCSNRSSRTRSRPLAEQPLHRALGLTDDELDTIKGTLGRDPNNAELAMHGAMWSEHCAYKSSKVHLKTLPTEGDAVTVRAGEVAGGVDLGE